MRGGRKPLAVLRRQQIRLVPNLDDALRVVRIDAELPQNDGDIAGLSFCFAVGYVADVQQDVSLDHVLQGRPEGSNKHGWQIGDEADRVRQNGLLAVRQLDGAGGWIKGRE